MFENIMKFFKKKANGEDRITGSSKNAAKERLHLVLMQDRANVSADFLELMKQEIIEVIKKYIDVDEKAIDVRLTNKENADGTNGAPALYANIPIINIKNEARKVDSKTEKNTEPKKENKKASTKKEIKDEDAKINKEDSKGQAKNAESKKQENKAVKSEEAKKDVKLNEIAEESESKSIENKKTVEANKDKTDDTKPAEIIIDSAENEEQEEKEEAKEKIKSEN